MDNNVVRGDKRKQDLNSGGGDHLKRPKLEESIFSVPHAGYLVKKTTMEAEAEEEENSSLPLTVVPISRGCKQFWKAGDYEDSGVANSTYSSVGMDHVRVHPKFLHSNATSHKWALGAFAELLDNALDEVCNGATYVNVDVMKNQKDGSKMLLVADNGGGMNPDKMRQCISLGYSAKSKMANTIGQYGNGFKTSTMRLGADVIVFSRCNDGKSVTLSIGLLSYTFLRATGKEDILVPMIDFEKRTEATDWEKKIRSSLNSWNTNLDIILQWSPFLNEQELFKQFNLLEDKGTRIIIYNLWEDEHGNSELDFDSDPYDIQIRGVNRDEKNIQMAKQYPNSRHFLTYQHSLRSYVAILYLKLPMDFRIYLRGKDIEYHDIVNDMMLAKEIVYRPQNPESMPKNNSEFVARGTIGFVKDAHHHIDVQGFNIYHKNRLIKPFWRVWNAAGSDGRGVIGVMEVNFVEPAHDKQGFERTTALSKLEARLIAIQKNYWSSNCQEIGYAARRQSKNQNSSNRESSSQSNKHKNGSAEVSPSAGNVVIDPNRPQSNSSTQVSPAANAAIGPNQRQSNKSKDGSTKGSPAGNVVGPNQKNYINLNMKISERAKRCLVSDSEDNPLPNPAACGEHAMAIGSHSKDNANNSKEKGPELRNRLNGQNGKVVDTLIKNLAYERDKRRKLEYELEEKSKEVEAFKMKAEQLDKDKIFLVEILQEERTRREKVEEDLATELVAARKTIEDLKNRMGQLEG